MANQSHSSPIIIGIASNTHPWEQVSAALAALQALFPGLRHSTPHLTAPLQHVGPDYLNALAIAETTLPPAAVIQALKQLERNQGRQPGKYQSIPLDLDLLAYGDLISPTLRLPRRELFTRDFNRLAARELKCLPENSGQAFA